MARYNEAKGDAKFLDKPEGQREKMERKKKLLFWNVAGLAGKDTDFWSYIEEFQFVGLVETCVEEKNQKN